jgi:hypothetical protein
MTPFEFRRIILSLVPFRRELYRGKCGDETHVAILGQYSIRNSHAKIIGTFVGFFRLDVKFLLSV